MKKRYVFNIPGEPVRVYKTEDEGRQPFDTYMENKLRYKITLESQHASEEPISTPVEAIFKFFLPRTARYRQPFVSVVKLFEFVSHAASGTIYKKDCLLYAVTLIKEYSNNPHTEIIIEPVKRVKGGVNEAKKRKKDNKKK